MIHLDGSQGEGGGQILRTALALSIVTGRSFRLTHIRAARPKPGLMRQHLACVQAAARIGSARVDGAGLGVTELTFEPGELVPGRHEFRIGSAGSTLLVLQTILPPLMLADRPSEIVLEGGTHNPFAPPFPFIAAAFLPLLRRLGFRVTARLEHAGFYSSGGGRCHFEIEPVEYGAVLALEAPESLLESRANLSALVCLSGLSPTVAEREFEIVREGFGILPDQCELDACIGSVGPGNTVHVRVGQDDFSEVFTGFGAPHVRSEEVARGVVDAVEAFRATGAPVGEQLADQLLLPLALGQGGQFVTVAPSAHTCTNAEVIREFLDTEIAIVPDGFGRWRIAVEGRKSS